MADTQEENIERQTLVFPDGLPGFPECERFVLVELVEDGVFQQLQSLDDPDVSMIVSVPWVFFPDYAPELTPVEQAELGIATPEDAVLFCSVTLDAESEKAYMNLLGPFVVNATTRRGRQVVLADSDYPIRAPLDLEID